MCDDRVSERERRCYPNRDAYGNSVRCLTAGLFGRPTKLSSAVGVGVFLYMFIAVFAVNHYTFLIPFFNLHVCVEEIAGFGYIKYAFII